MRYFLPILTLCFLTSCTVWDGIFKKSPAPTEMAEVPTNLEGPAYDPSTSPAVMTQGTVLPRPQGAAQPAAYGSAPEGPVAYGSAPQSYGSPPENPADYPPATAVLSPDQEGKGGAAPAVYSPQTPEEVTLAATLNGLWVSAADAKEVVEFTPDHYTTFYNGEMLFQEPMTYHPACPGDCNGGVTMQIPCFTVSGPAGTDCYGIIRLTPEVLEMSMLGVSTETILYRKQ